MNRLVLFVAPIAICTLSACAPRVAPVDPKGVSVIRTYSFDTTVADPQPTWNPNSYLIVARSSDGFGLLQEGSGRQEYFTSSEKRETHTPQWLNANQFVYGPKTNVIPLADGRVVGSSDGLTVVDVTDDGVRTKVSRTMLTSHGYRPRVGSGNVVFFQDEDAMRVVDKYGKVLDAGSGFFPEPQPKGEGICWQDQPVIEQDYWSPQPGRGNLIIRWRPGVVTTIPGGIQARWTNDGSVVCTQLQADPDPHRPWWTAGTDVVFVPGPNQVPYVIAKNARDPDPHPSEPLVAVTDGDGGTRIVSRRPAPLPPANRITTVGEHPRFSYDGLRLLTEEGSATDTKRLTIYVLKLVRSQPVEE